VSAAPAKGRDGRLEFACRGASSQVRHRRKLSVVKCLKKQERQYYLNSQLLGVLGGKDFRYTYPNGHEVEYTVALFRCEVDSRNSEALDNETVDLRFFSKANMPKLGFP
jgi:hypothetical protein